ncbi:MAG: hypothetical protein GY816_04180, partial [Cytophagales bacterium]|nr:hypothetical protein [Cytophagales bacterium]
PFHLEWTRMPFGLCNSPVFFMNYMTKTLYGVDDDRVFVFIDDIIIVGETMEVLVKTFQKVLQKLRLKQLRLKPSKCEFLCDKVTFLGLVLDKRGLQTDPKKVDSIQTFPEPQNIKETRSFLGMAGYFRRFIQNFSSIAKPLTRLQEKDVKFEFNQDCRQAFLELKQRLITAPILAYPDFSKDFYIECDASLHGVGAQLLQRIDTKELE